MPDADFLAELQILKQKAKHVRREATMMVQLAARLEEAAAATDTSKEDTNAHEDRHN